MNSVFGRPVQDGDIRLDMGVRTSRRKEEAQSPSQQRQIADQHELLHPNHRIVKIHDSGKSESGKTMERSTLMEMRRRLDADLTDGYFFSYLDRSGRADTDEALAFAKELVKVGGGVFVAADFMGGMVIDLDNPITKQMFTMQLANNRAQWETSRNRIVMSRGNALKQGWWLSGKAPLGFIHPQRRSCLIVDEPLRPVIIEMFKHRLDGYTIAQLWEWLNDELRGLNRDPYLAAKGVHKFLTNKAYIGEQHVKGYEPNLESHELIVPKRLFTKVQKMVKPRPGRNSKSPQLLARLGILRCGNCNSLMSVSTAKGTGNRDGSRGGPGDIWEPMYRCTNLGCKHRVAILCRIANRVVWEWTVRHHATGDGNVADTPRKLAQERKEVQDEYNDLMAINPETGRPTFNASQDADRKYKASLEAAIADYDEKLGRFEDEEVLLIPASGVLKPDTQRKLIKRAVDCAIVRPVSTHGVGAQRVEVIGFD